jgi:aspartyl-tRNA(Asn)/glutamyl-tRNA(Gln) amidotransferase subunit C
MDVKNVAKLAHLRISDEEAAVYQPQMEGILAYIEQLNGLDTSDVEPMTGGLTAEGAATETLRDDSVGESLGQDAAVSQAPSAVAGHFRVPKVL